MTNHRTEILNCIMECNLPQTRTQSIDAMARMYTDDLVKVLIKEYYLLRDEYDELLITNEKLKK